MMEERMKWARRLNKLVENNFQIARTYQRMVEAVAPYSLKKFLIRQASRTSKHAMELEQEVKFLGGSTAGVHPPRISGFKTRSMNLIHKSTPLLFQYCVRRKKRIIKQYKKALSAINEGSSREILLRHIATYEADLRELNLLKDRFSPKSGRRALLRETN